MAIYYFMETIKEIIIKLLYYIKQAFQDKPDTLHGSASWHSAKFKILSKTNTGLTVNGIERISLEDSYKNSIIIAPPGQGKTTTYIIPNVLNLNHSMIITDPSGEIYQSTKDTLFSKIYDVRVINPNDPENTYFYNPLQRANTITDINKITDTLINNAYQNDKSTTESSFWNTGAKNILNLVIQAVKKNPDPFKRNLKEARRFLLLYGQPDEQRKMDKLTIEIEKYLYDDQEAMQELASFFHETENVRTSFITTAKTALNIFNNPNVCTLTNKDDICFESIKNGRRPVAIFLMVPEHETQYYSFLLNLFYTQVFNYCAFVGLEKTKPVFFLLDEFGNMGTLPYFNNIITTLRKRNCSISIILQDIKQLNNLYGRDTAETIFNSCASKIFFSNLGLETCEKVEKLLGKQTVNHKNSGTGKTTLHGRALMTSDEIRCLDRSKIIYIFSNQKPLLLKTKYYDVERKRIV